MQIFLGKNTFLYKKKCIFAAFSERNFGGIAPLCKILSKIELGARRRPKVLLFDKWRALARIHDQIYLQKKAFFYKKSAFYRLKIKG